MLENKLESTISSEEIKNQYSLWKQLGRERYKQNVARWVRNSTKKVNYHAEKLDISLPESLQRTKSQNISLLVYLNTNIVNELAQEHNGVLGKHFDSLKRAYDAWEKINY